MSGYRPRALTEFYDSLHRRGVDTESLAFELDVSGGAVRRLLAGLRPRRGPIWKGILARLTPAEITLLETAEQCPTWNASRQRRKREIWSTEKAQRIAASTGRSLQEVLG